MPLVRMRSALVWRALALLALAAMGCDASWPDPVSAHDPPPWAYLPRNQKLDKLDLLFVIDNSASMADKQKVLAAAVLDLVERLTNPVCVNRETREVTAKAAPREPCPASSERQFEPVVDIHIGVITSSLGGVGADSCSNDPTQNWNPRQEDMSHLVTRGEPTDPVTWNDKGFLNWDPTGKKSSPAISMRRAIRGRIPPWWLDVRGPIGALFASWGETFPRLGVSRRSCVRGKAVHAGEPVIARSGRVAPTLLLSLAAMVGCDASVVAEVSSAPVCHAGQLIRRPAGQERLDVLFVIDNSESMGDKQNVLAAAVPDLVDQLTHPACVDVITRERVVLEGC